MQQFTVGGKLYRIKGNKGIRMSQAEFSLFLSIPMEDYRSKRSSPGSSPMFLVMFLSQCTRVE